MPSKFLHRGALIAALALALGACGGADDEAPSTAAATATPTATATAAATAAATEEAAAASGDGKPTPLGTTLKIGEPAVIEYKDASTQDEGLIELTPRKLEKGTLEDFKNIDLDAKQKASTPFYATIEVKNVGTTSLDGASPATYINGVDDRGQDQNEIIFIGGFDRCDQETPKKFGPGDSYSACLVYLIPQGGSIEGFHWIQFDEKSGKSDLRWE